ncbi:MFS transporter [Nitrospina sp. 32_T5]|uniref:MFS transporter n=1 Tax=unclassified Nitrospina TaxID=2638683 RepID=UPI003F9A8165
MATDRSAGYVRLLKSNRPFRNLWYAQVVSELGDWLNSIAIFALVLKVGGTGMAMATVMMAKLLPIFFVSPIAGVLIDRMDRRAIMMASDVFRFVVVLGFLLVEDQNDLWLLYTLAVVEIALAGFFEPARSAVIPSLCTREELVTANALSGSTWSVMLALGAALGGGVVSLFGIKAAFVVDAFTFLVSAFFVSRIQFPVKAAAGTEDETPRTKKENGWVEGMKYLVRRPVVGVLSLLKSGLALGGGLMTLIPLYANTLFSTEAAISMATGLMYSARGLGAALGPVLVKRFFGDSTRVLQLSIFSAFFISGVGFYFLSRSFTLGTAAVSIGLVTFFGSIIWVFSSALIHLEAEDRFLGRVFSTEMAMLTLVMGLSNWWVGYSIDHLGWTLSEVALGLAAAFALPGTLWGLFLLVRRRAEKRKAVDSICPVEPSDSKLPPSNY